MVSLAFGPSCVVCLFCWLKFTDLCSPLYYILLRWKMATGPMAGPFLDVPVDWQGGVRVGPMSLLCGVLGALINIPSGGIGHCCWLSLSSRGVAPWCVLHYRKEHDCSCCFWLSSTALRQCEGWSSSGEDAMASFCSTSFMFVFYLLLYLFSH